MIELFFNQAEEEQHTSIMAELVRCIRDNLPIKLPPSKETSQFEGALGEFRYVFDAEEDLLHLAISRKDCGPITAEEAQLVVQTVLPGFPPALIWLKPAVTSQHFYLGQDELLERISI